MTWLMIWWGVFLVWALIVGVNGILVPVNFEWILSYFGPPQMQGWSLVGFFDAQVRIARAFFGLVLVALAVLGTGKCVVGFFARSVRGPVRGHAKWICGQAAGAFVVLGLGLAGLANRYLIWVLLLVAAVAGTVQVCSWLAKRSRPTLFRGGMSLTEGSLLILTALGVLVVTMNALAPLVGFDSLIHYFAIPNRELLSHRLTCVTGIPTDGYPGSFEQLILLGLVVGKEATGKLLVWFELVLAGVALGGYLVASGASSPARRAALCLYWTLPLTGLMPHFTTGDCAVVHGTMVGLWLLVSGRFSALALLLGWLMALKYSAFVAVAPLGVGILLRNRRHWPLLFLCLLCVLPWWGRNYLGHGQPFFPLFWCAIPSFESRFVLDCGSNVASFMTDFSGLDALLSGLHRRWQAFFGLNARDLTYVVIPVVLLLVPLAMSRTRRMVSVVVALAFLAWVALGGAILRYLMPVIPWILAESLLTLSRKGILRRVGFAVILLGVFQLAHNCSWDFRMVNPSAVVLGGESPDDYKRRIVTPVPHYMDLAKTSGSRFLNGRTYILGDIKSYYWSGEFLLENLTMKPRLSRWIEDSESPERLMVKFKQHDVTHLVYYASGMLAIHGVSPNAFAWTPRRLGLYQTFWEQHMEARGELVSPRGRIFYYFFDVVGRSGNSWPLTTIPFTLPGTEGMTTEGDEAFMSGDVTGALRWFEGMNRKVPGFEPIQKRVEMLREERR